jgi:hypothetical protein
MMNSNNKIKIAMCIAVLLSLVLSYRQIIPRDTLALINSFRNDIYNEIWKGALDLTRKGSTANATISSNKMFRYGVFANCNIDDVHIVYSRGDIQFNGIIKYTIYNDGEVVETKVVESSQGWRGGNGEQEDFWRESLFPFWMPYADKYETVTIQMEVLEPDPTFLEKRSNVYLSIRGEWVP